MWYICYVLGCRMRRKKQQMLTLLTSQWASAESEKKRTSLVLTIDTLFPLLSTRIICKFKFPLWSKERAHLKCHTHVLYENSDVTFRGCFFFPQVDINILKLYAIKLFYLSRNRKKIKHKLYFNILNKQYLSKIFHSLWCKY